MFATVEEAINLVREGSPVILVDDERRENEGDLVLAAGNVRPEGINFMLKHGRGMICLALDGAIVRRLQLPVLNPRNDTIHGTAYHAPIDARTGVTTGASVHDRATTIRTAVRPDSGPDDLIQGGHVSTLQAADGGVLVRAGHTEGSVDLMRLAGLEPAAVICEILDEDGGLARLNALEKLAEEHGLKILQIADLIRYRRARERLVEYVAHSGLPTRHGIFTQYIYQAFYDPEPHVALVKGERIRPEALRGDAPPVAEPVLVRVHSECLTGDTFGSVRCDCGEQLAAALGRIESEGSGVLLYMRQEGRGIGFVNKVRAYGLQDRGLDTVEANERLGFPADLRHYGVGAQILYDLGIRRIRLLTNNPKKVAGLEGYGLEIVEEIRLRVPPAAESEFYLRTKRERLGHLL